MVDENTDEALSDGGEFLGEEEYVDTYTEDVVVVDQVSPGQGTSWFLVLSGVGFLMAGVALVFAPDIDLEHQFRSRFDRLLLQWTPTGWILVAPWVASLLPTTPNSRS